MLCGVIKWIEMNYFQPPLCWSNDWLNWRPPWPCTAKAAAPCGHPKLSRGLQIWCSVQPWTAVYRNAKWYIFNGAAMDEKWRGYNQRAQYTPPEQPPSTSCFHRLVVNVLGFCAISRQDTPFPLQHFFLEHKFESTGATFQLHCVSSVIHYSNIYPWCHGIYHNAVKEWTHWA